MAQSSFGLDYPQVESALRFTICYHPLFKPSAIVTDDFMNNTHVTAWDFS